MIDGPANTSLPTDLKRQIDGICDDFETVWRSGNRPRIEDFVVKVPVEGRSALLYTLVTLEVELRDAEGERVIAASYNQRFSKHSETIGKVFANLAQTQSFRADGCETSRNSEQGQDNHPTSSGSGTQQDGVPERIGKYAVKRKLGEGTFGIVYLAVHPQLDRDVALKVARLDRFQSDGDADRFREEARNSARIKAPGIVTVYDVDQDGDRVFIVQEYVDGINLKEALRKASYTPVQVADRIAEIAEAVGYSHQQGVYHCDLKPSNILLDKSGRVFVADFGLALHKSLRRSREREISGTPRYMSPEQARGETHRLDGRCDIWSLGVMLYEMLAGQSPFFGDDLDGLFDEILHSDPQPPRQLNPQLPTELERICLKCLSKRMTDRYTTASDLAYDLSRWLADEKVSPARHTPGDSERPAQVIPKGLRSFDDEDANFFLELLPGPKDHDGLPDAIRFWKTRIERTDSDGTFAVGLIYGPSGGGKSSMVKAGLLPCLGNEVVPIYVEATVQDTEFRFLKELRKRFFQIPTDLSLPEILARFREGAWLPSAHKLVIVFDQFEQWLHSVKDLETSQLVEALRQCDGGRVQCIIMVRDDFWMGATRLQRALEIDLVPGQNAAAVDRFDFRHARKVLTLFGQAYGALPEDLSEISRDQQAFVDQSVQALADDGRVVSVHLALFAEMVKGKPWIPTTLKLAGGTEGIGVAFLEETFNAPSANPTHRLHAEAARGVLKTLLPVTSLDIKGLMKSSAELLEASGYEPRMNDFYELIRILDGELRLITPIDPMGAAAKRAESPEGKHYQLTHDYLVRPLRDWLNRKQKESWRGRAALRLEELVSHWNREPQPPLLPSTSEYFGMLLGVRRSQRTTRQKELLRVAGRRHLMRWSIVSVLVCSLLIALSSFRRYRAEALNGRVAYLLTCRPESILEAIEDLRPYRGRAVPMLRKALDYGNRGKRLHAAVALTMFGESADERLMDAIADPRSQVADCASIVTALKQSGTGHSLLSKRFSDARSASSRVRYAIVALHLGNTELAKQIVRLDENPQARTVFIHKLREWHGDLLDLAELLKSARDPHLQTALCQAIAILDSTSLAETTRGRCIDSLQYLYEHAHNAGTHNAALHALRTLGVEPQPLQQSSVPIHDRGWFVNSSGMTMVKIPAGSMTLGQDLQGLQGLLNPDEFARQKIQVEEVDVPQPLFVSSCEVSVRKFREFAGEHAAKGHEAWQADDPDENPARYVNWFDAIAFCNWLSERERRTPCYFADGTLEIRGLPSRPPAEYPDWQCDWDANGYRLPTSDEWEYACRAGANTAFPFGSFDQRSLLKHYAWYQENVPTNGPQRCGTKLPNRWGLFDMPGNVYEWCWDTSPRSQKSKVTRGGAFIHSAHHTLLCGFRSDKNPGWKANYVGFRVVCAAGK